jgi:dTDP-glucose 4,6-dehydratase
MARQVWLDQDVFSSSSEGWAREHCRFHHVSTDEVYGTLGPDDPAFTEQTAYAPNSPYAASKAASDHLVRAYHKTYGLPVTISNCSNNFGPYQFPEKLIPLMISYMLDGKALPVYGDGKQIRDWLYVEDHCRGIDCILQKGKTGETYNIGGNCEITNLTLVHELARLMDSSFPSSPLVPHVSLIRHVRDRPGHDRRYAINSQKIHDQLGFVLENDFAQALKKTVLWYLEHESWWRELMDEQYSEWIASHYEE